MDGSRFDALTRGVARDTSRRRLFGIVLGGAITALPGTAAFAAKGRRRRGKGSGQSADESPGIPGTQVGGVWDDTIEICHFDAETKNYHVMMVSAPSLPDYLALGDTLYIDCCVDTECGKQVCMTPTGCKSGACMYEVTEGASCALDGGATGYCDGDANCIGTITVPADTIPVDTTVVETVPVDTVPVEPPPMEYVPVEYVPVENVPVDAIPVPPSDGMYIE
jgi:hypothetical protein